MVMEFLATEFDMPPTKAAALVSSDPDEIVALAARELERRRGETPYGEAPIPASSERHPIPNNGGLQKPVINRSDYFRHYRG